MPEIGKIFIGCGLLLVLIGIAFSFSDKMPWLGKLPGDVLIKRENFTFYFPLATCIIISIIISLIAFLWNQK